MATNRWTIPALSPNRLLHLFSARDLEALIDAAFPLLAETVDCDFVSAFYRQSQKGLLMERDSRGREYGPDFMRRNAELNPAIPLARAQPGVELLHTAIALPRSESVLKKSEYYREVMQPQGWRHSVALCFWSQPISMLPVFVMSVYRQEGRPDFSQRDCKSLREIHPFIGQALTRFHETAVTNSVRDGLAMSVRHGAKGVAVLDWHLRLVEANSVARRMCASWKDQQMRGSRPGKHRTTRSRERWRLPIVLGDECRRLRDAWESQLQANPTISALRRSSKIAHPHFPGVTAAITILCRNETPLAEPSFIVEFERVERADDCTFVLEQMTASERSVALILIDGLTNQEIADQLAKSVTAVKFLLHSIYRKTGLANRAALVAVLRSGRVPAHK
jgi:DNA-binding CsgD family transcriptional regulator